MVKIDAVKFGEIRVDGRDYYSDIVLWWDGKVELVTKQHVIGINRMALLLDRKPEAVVIGTGMQGVVKLAPEARQVCEDRKVRLYTDPTEKAVEFFNGLMAQGRKAVGYFHVTC